MKDNDTTCALCSQTLTPMPILEKESSSFCCVGCQTVFNILQTKNELSDFKNHPLFKQALQSGLISNPALLTEIKSKEIDVSIGEMEKFNFEIQDLWCPSCAEVIRYVLLRERGVNNCAIDYSTDLASVEYSPKHISKDKIISLIRKLGYSPFLFSREERRAVSFSLYLRLIVAAFFAANVMMFSYPIYASYFSLDQNDFGNLFAWLSLYASLPVLLYSAWPIFKRFFKSFFFGFIGMEALIVIGVLTSFGLSVYELINGGQYVYFDSMTVIITFVLLGKVIESKAKFSTKETLFRLSKAIPKRGRKITTQGSELFVLTKEVNKDDLMKVLAGEKIVLDGVVVEGEGNCDESLMTGESLPVKKNIGDKLIAGTILLNGVIVFRVTSGEQETALHHIIDTIEKDIGQKSAYTRAADPIAGKFVPLVCLIALVTGFALWLAGESAQEAIIRSISVLLISCPCAIGIAAPIAESEILKSMANLGAIVRNRGCLADFGKEDVFVFDKTGTITEGKFQVLDGLESLSTDQLRLLKTMTSHSNHPVSRAILLCSEQSPTANDCSEPSPTTNEIPGKGLIAKHNGYTYFLGSKDLARMQGIKLEHTNIVNTQVVSVVYFGNEHGVLSEILLGDRIRKDAVETIAALKPVQTVLLSGDGINAVKKVAEACKFDEWKAEIGPLEKRDYIDTLRKQGKNVCMMGDGINDAPALTGANTGISVLSATDLSIQVSDIMLTTDKLSVIPKIRALAKFGRKIIKQNLFWAFFYNIIGIGLAVFGYLNPLLSAIAMVLSSLIVIGNAQRIKI